MFNLKSTYQPAGDQPQAISKLVGGLQRGDERQTLLGVTGSGKTFTMANIIAQTQRPALVVAHNKTLAAQLCNEFRQFFPDNAVEYFVSYYDYYQPEAYLARTDTYIEKEAQINDEIDRLRHATTQALLSRRDTIVVASVSCIYSVGSPEEYQASMLHISANAKTPRDVTMHQLIDMQFERTTADVERGTFRVRGDILEVMPMNEETLYRVEFTDEHVASIRELDAVTRRHKKDHGELWLFPARHYMTAPSVRDRAIVGIRTEMKEQVATFEKEGKLLEAERLQRRTTQDMAMIEQTGFCSGIENYSRWFDGRKPGEPPYTLLDFFPDDFLTFIDESHVTRPQIGAMLNGDKARKKNLIDFGFRLPSAADNRPLSYDEFDARIGQCIYVSATPSEREIEESTQVVEQVIRPTGLVDPEILVRSVTGSKDAPGQVDDLIPRIKERVEGGDRVLVTTLTKKMAEDLSAFLADEGMKVGYLHSDIQTLDRIKILTEFRQGVIDIVVGVNLLREGLDLPEVSLVAILDADKEGFLRSETSLIQTIGRAARNVRGQVVLYADTMTGSLKRAIKETERRRKKQLAYNKEHGITPATIVHEVGDIRQMFGARDEESVRDILKIELTAEPHEIEEVIKEKEAEMKHAARELDFETAAILRDEVAVLQKELAKKDAPP
ncbi:excinuclease ABC subunit B [Candidatus Uhrbacteria bacterium RIFCSPHIGHO2_02_FULL_53_13]|uniref:UvrABC system protein B n=1 Tax=Candidatus Uhrbacteria bacterium RIFCSPHIGHO2_02_FULL_53_13 TaxID=1802389 RepID=A0A1F7TYZ6_9BACT|nr:MAG: excinuclease ABC subunit B [Candidatus Uhrbacteria bacterium RIFCSPHIGHO2_02_FULL_53_13]